MPDCRYDYQTPFREAHDLVSNFNPATGQIMKSPARCTRPTTTISVHALDSRGSRSETLSYVRAMASFTTRLSVGDSLFLLGLNPPFVHFDVKNNGPVLPDFDLTTAFQSDEASTQPSIFSTSRQLPNPYVQQWSTSIEVPVQQLFVLDVSYFGQKGTRLRRQVNLNQPGPGPAGTLDDRRPFLGFQKHFPVRDERFVDRACVGVSGGTAI